MFYQFWQNVILQQKGVNLWMSKGMHDRLALVIKILGVDSQPKHVTFGLFEVVNTLAKTLAKNLIKFYQKNII